MGVATLELCKELYGLSGWKTDYYWVPSSVNVSPDVNNPSYEVRAWEEITSHTNWDKALQISLSVPAYDLGYLLRKLPEATMLTKFSHSPYRKPWGCRLNSPRMEARKRVALYKQADTPEDAAAKLAIELFKQGRLKKEPSND